MRAKLSPTFTSGKMKIMFSILANIAEDLQKTVEVNAINGTPIEAKDIIIRYNMDVISSCAFGIETHALSNPNVPFATMGKKIFEPTFLNLSRNFFSFFVPEVARFFKVRHQTKVINNNIFGIIS